ncbi:MAG TPA: hypothetical protein VJT75_00820 [Thermoleophilaceae bacterium]|nr:hypothetical protein [Thermoleophilaceae bacterium]
MRRPRVKKLRHRIAHPPPGEQLVDDFLRGYVAWREACSSVASAYRRWACAPLASRTSAFAEYGSALDREEQAAGAYRRLTRLVQDAEAERRSAARPRP